MTTDKKNQHYIPKFYLRYFSINGNKKQIGVYNVESDRFIPKGKLKTQGSKNFFYGSDGVLEDTLSEWEGKFATCINKIKDDIKLPKLGDNSILDLLAFVATTHLRNPVMIDMIKSQSSVMKNALKAETKLKFKDELFPDVPHDLAVAVALEQVPQTAMIMSDLSVKLLINNTKYPFITSDFPIVKYNQFLEKNNWQESRTGYGAIGLQIFIPISSSLMIVFFDSDIYKVGNKKDKVVEINDKSSIDNLNILQFVNCYSNVFCDEKASDLYLKELSKQSKKFEKANRPLSKMSYIVDKSSEALPKEKNLITYGVTDCNVKLTVEKIEIHSKGKM